MKRALLAWGLCVLCLLLTLAGILLYWESLGHDQISRLYPNAVVIALVFPLVGGLIVVRQPHNPIGWLFGAWGYPRRASPSSSTMRRIRSWSTRAFGQVALALRG